MRVPGVIAWGFLFLSFWVWAGAVLGQTYTSNSNGNWNNAGRWTITNSVGCGTPIPSTPPVGTNNSPCPIRIIINHNVSSPGDLTLGNNNTVTIQIAANRTLTVEDNLSVTGYNNKILNISGSGNLEIGENFNITGNSNVALNEDLDIEVEEDINITEAAQFTANGNLRFFSEQVTISGNGSLNFSALSNTVFETTNGDFNIQNGSNVLVSGSSGIISDRDFRINEYTPN